MKELILDPVQLDPELGRSGSYTYAILIDEMDVGNFSCESYGVRITSNRTGDTAAIPHITVSIPRIDSLMELLIRNNVSPDHLRDVVDDWL